jgi:hypothetical protein
MISSYAVLGFTSIRCCLEQVHLNSIFLHAQLSRKTLDFLAEVSIPIPARIKGVLGEMPDRRVELNGLMFKKIASYTRVENQAF